VIFHLSLMALTDMDWNLRTVLYIPARLRKVTKLLNRCPLSFHRWTGELDSNFPASLGVFSFAISGLYFVGVGAWHFDYEMTWNTGVYDWLS
jgi:hypothetical protein